MEQLRNIEQCLISSVQGQMGDLKKVNAKEMGEVIDMIKDLEEAMYYCSIIEAMEKASEKEEMKQPMNISYYMEGNMPPHYYSEGGQGNNNPSMSGSRNYTPYMEYAPYMMRDKQWREDHMGEGARSYYSRKMYMESQKSGDSQKSMKELEHYMKDLGEDLAEMIISSTPEEKQVLANKLQQLAMKVNK